ncbi:MAG: D-alanyl-D-alanine carboxypeptidase [Actinomycetota bacterium]|nr:D-alanyl-D-alanine carboxypeptidase [Actinomycetota bacterium]
MSTFAGMRWWLYGVLDEAMRVPPGDYEGLHTEFARRLNRFCADHPGLEVLSGHRTSEEQQYLYAHQHDPGFNPANPPGESNHEAIPWGKAQGLAADLWPESVFDSGDISDDEHDEIRRKYGIHFPLRHTENEDHHAQPVEVESPRWSGMPDLPRWEL